MVELFQVRDFPLKGPVLLIKGVDRVSRHNGLCAGPVDASVKHCSVDVAELHHLLPGKAFGYELLLNLHHVVIGDLAKGLPQLGPDLLRIFAVVKPEDQLFQSLALLFRIIDEFTHDTLRVKMTILLQARPPLYIDDYNDTCFSSSVIDAGQEADRISLYVMSPMERCLKTAVHPFPAGDCAAIPILMLFSISMKK